MKVLVIGGGIYGCHLALSLKNKNIEVDLFEKNKELFLEASGKNQYRLHQGFHYARNYVTRNQSKKGFDIFLDLYGKFTKKISNNYYFVPKENSLFDFGTYISIFRNEKYDFEVLSKGKYGFLNEIEGGFLVNERVIDVDGLRKMFSEELRDVIKYETEVLPSELDLLKFKYDYIIDCTWGRLIKFFEFEYELTHLCYVKTKTKNHPAITLVDGPLWSIYPTSKDNIYTLSSVVNTPLFKDGDLDKVLKYKSKLTEDYLLSNYDKMVVNVEKNYKKYSDKFSLEGHQISIKTKPPGNSDPRDCRTFKNDNIISIFSGKIDTFYVAEDYINKLLK
ncbi:FAD-binding oxidoreductase [Flavobacteriaceae bacterium]|nr:FAD-binding oxidoreductase [Flavobacteriaceae bacterium]MDC1542171.1 FAD-binding oxidoreductase [Flavobacteriaceae bacterium]